MATTLPAASTQQARSSAQNELPFDHVRRIDGPSRIVEGDIEILQMNLVQLYNGRYEARSTAWDRLESAWKTVRPELADDSASSPLTGVVPPGNGAAVAAAEVDAPMAVVATVPLALRSQSWVTGVLGPAISSKARQVVVGHGARPRAELGAAALRVRRFVSSAAFAGAKHASHGWRGLQRVVRNKRSPWGARGHASKVNGRHGRPPDLSLPRSKLPLARSNSIHWQAMRPVGCHYTMRPPLICRLRVPIWPPSRGRSDLRTWRTGATGRRICARQCRRSEPQRGKEPRRRAWKERRRR